MNQDLLFGAAYYLEYMPYDRVEEDVRMMKEAGMNVARIAESTWSTLEPVEGEFDFSYIDKTLAVLEREGMKSIIGTPTYAVPSWLVKKDPNVMVQRKEGQAMYGHRQCMDINNVTYRTHAERVIRKLIEHTASYDCVIGFQIDNETKHYGTSSTEVQALFVAHLKEKFITTEAMNQAYGLAYWSNSIHDWSHFPDMNGCINGSLAGEYEEFQRQLAVQFLQWQGEIVAQYKREDQFITHNLDFEWRKFGADIAQDGYSYGVQPDINHNEVAKNLTIVGTDIYHPTQDDLTGAEIAFCGDEIRSLKQDNYLVLECQAQAFKYWTPYKGQLRLQAYSHLASGASGVMYWNWHSIHNGYETYWKGVLSHDFASNKTYEEAKIIGAEWNQIGAEHLQIKKKNQVALIVDNRTLTSMKWFPIDRDLSYNDVVRWMYDSLYEENIECDIIHAGEFEGGGATMNDYKVLITPALYCASDSFLEQLNGFVTKGGTLISSFKSFVANEDVKVYHDTQPHGMSECFGMWYNQFTEPGTTTVNGEQVQYFAELLQTTTAEEKAKYEHRYWGEYSAITHNTFGNGNAYYIGCYTSKTVLKALYKEAMGAIEKTIESSWPVIAKSGTNLAGKQVQYIFNYSQENQVTQCAYEVATDLITGTQYKKGQSIKVSDWDVVVLEEQR